MSFVQYSVNDGLADIVLDRPKVNALNLALIEELGETATRAAKDPQVRGILVRSAGRAFSAGLDLKEVGALDRDGLRHFLKRFDSSLREAFNSPKPLACAVAGHAIAGGLVLALGADFLALGKGDYKVGLTELSVGVPFPRMAFEMVASALPPRAVRRLIYTADTMGPQEAFDLGVGDVLTDDPLKAARDWLELTTLRPMHAFQVAKRQIRAEAWSRIDAAPATEADDFIEGVLSDSGHSALAATLDPGRR